MIDAQIQIYNATSSDWETVTTAVYPITLNDRLNKELDDGNFVFYSASENIYPPFTPCKVTIGTTVRYYYMSDAAVWFGGEYWQHTATLTEPTKILEGYFISGLAVTQPRTSSTSTPSKTLYDVLQRVLNVTPLRIQGENPIFQITSDTKVVELLQGTVSPEFRWGSQTTLWEVLADIGAYVDAMPRLVPNSTNDGVYDTITFDFINEVSEILDAVSYTQCSHAINEEQYCSALETDAENIVAGNAEEASTVFPGQDAWITPRSTEIRLNTNNSQIVLLSNIERLNSIVVNGNDIKLHLVNNSGNIDKTLADLGISELDITDFVVENAEWQTLDTESTINPLLYDIAYSNYTNNTWTYALHSNLINVTGSLVAQGSQTTIAQLVLGSAAVRALSNGETITTNAGTFYAVTYNGEQYGISYASQGYTSSGGAQQNLPLDVRFRVNYNALNSASKTRTIKSQKPDVEFVQAFNQRAEINNAQAFGRNMKGTVDRMGVEVTEYFLRVMDPTEVYPVGSAFVQNNELFIITTVQQEIYAEIINVTYGLSQNWNLISQYVSIDRKFRNWNIPADTLQRNLYDFDYAVISDEPTTFSARLNASSLSTFANVFKCTQSSSQTEVNNAWMTNTSTATGAVLNASSFSMGSSVLFVGKTKDNLSAGTNRTLKDNAYICRDVYYCNDDGTLDEATLVLAAAINLQSTDQYPYSYSRTPMVNIPSLPMLSKSYYVDKDPAEQLTFTYQLHFATRMTNIIIGPQIGATLPFVRQWNENKTFKLWGLTSQVPQNAVKMLTAWGGVITTISSDSNSYLSANFNSSNNNVQITVNNVPNAYVGWAITDEDNNLYLAYNSTPNGATTLYMGFAHEY